jgi:ferritin
MLISPELNAAFNEHIGQEMFASHQYVNMAADFDDRALRLLSEMFFKQADEEREHAMKFVRYLTEVDGQVVMPAIEAPVASFQSVEQIFQLALDWEMEVTRQINALVAMAEDAKDYAAREFLKWFVTEQVEEVKTMSDLLKIAKAVGERNIIAVEAYLAHKD